MVKQIVRDIFFLGQPSEPATQADLSVEEICWIPCRRIGRPVWACGKYDRCEEKYYYREHELDRCGDV